MGESVAHWKRKDAGAEDIVAARLALSLSVLVPNILTAVMSVLISA